jgi:predicted Zn-dependent protease with MMP-like domain
VNHRQFEAVIRRAIAEFPDWVREELENIDILVVDEPDGELDPDGEGLLGLYVGTPLPERSTESAGELSDIIYIFRRPHLDLGLTTNELLKEIVTTLTHEIAHLFGIDDDHLDDLGWA